MKEDPEKKLYAVYPVRIPIELYRKLRAHARKEKRSINYVSLVLIEKGLKAK